VNASLNSRPVRLRRGFVLPLVALAAMFLLLGCGSSSDSSERELEGEPFTETELADWTAVLADIEALSADGECEDADSKLATLRGEVEKSGSDEGLKADLITLLDGLDAKLAEECTAPSETTSSSTSSTEETESISTATEESTVTEEEPTTTEDEPEEPEEPQEPTPPPTPPSTTTTPPNTEGAFEPGAEGGISP